MTRAQFRKLKDRVERFGSTRIPEPGKRSYTEIIKWGPGDYAAYSVWPGDAHRVTERSCFATVSRLDDLADIFVDN